MGKAFPIYIQSDAMQCGATCLRMICSYYGIDYSLAFISEFCQASNAGVSLKGINDAATQMGFDPVCCRASLSEIENAPFPCILHWRQNHYVVLYKVRHGKKFYIADPGKGKICLNREEFSDMWLSTHSQNIIVLDKGKIAESGTHSQLIDRKGVYFHLIKNQLELGA